MLEAMTAEQFMRWELFYGEEPWGEEREDQRQAANTIYGLAPYMQAGAQLPDLTYPYFEDSSPESLAKRMRTMDAQIERSKWQTQSQNSQSPSSPTQGDSLPALPKPAQ
jgi:hypothetical protein